MNNLDGNCKLLNKICGKKSLGIAKDWSLVNISGLVMFLMILGFYTRTTQPVIQRGSTKKTIEMLKRLSLMKMILLLRLK